MGQPISLKLNTNHKCALLKKSEKVPTYKFIKTGNYKKKKKWKNQQLIPNKYIFKGTMEL